MCQKLEFYLRIFFAVYPVHPFNTAKPDLKLLKKEMDAFRTFLESKSGEQFVNTTEFLPFYALPFVPDPTKSQAFKNLFNKKWAEDLRGKLKIFIGHNVSKL